MRFSGSGCRRFARQLILRHARGCPCGSPVLLSTCQVLYLHSKGVTARHQVEPAHLRVYQWRTAMSYFLIYHHRAMLRLLDDFDVVGAIMDPA